MSTFQTFDSQSTDELATITNSSMVPATSDEGSFSTVGLWNVEPSLTYSIDAKPVDNDNMIMDTTTLFPELAQYFQLTSQLPSTYPEVRHSNNESELSYGNSNVLLAQEASSDMQGPRTVQPQQLPIVPSQTLQQGSNHSLDLLSRDRGRKARSYRNPCMTSSFSTSPVCLGTGKQTICSAEAASPFQLCASPITPPTEDDRLLELPTHYEDPGEQPYAQLIWQALLSVPSHSLQLQEIYDWIENKTGKVKDKTGHGWRNSVRHNLSMNQAFQKIVPAHKAKRGSRNTWRLADDFVKAGPVSTTRYRKKDPSHKRIRKHQHETLRRRQMMKRHIDVSPSNSTGRCRSARVKQAILQSQLKLAAVLPSNDEALTSPAAPYYELPNDNSQADPQQPAMPMSSNVLGTLGNYSKSCTGLHDQNWDTAIYTEPLQFEDHRYLQTTVQPALDFTHLQFNQGRLLSPCSDSVSSCYTPQGGRTRMEATSAPQWPLDGCYSFEPTIFSDMPAPTSFDPAELSSNITLPCTPSTMCSPGDLPAGLSYPDAGTDPFRQ